MATTYNDLYLDIRQQLIDRGITQPSLEAREIVTFVAGKTREEFFRDARIYVPEHVYRGSYELLERRLRGEPLAYIIGEWEFMGIPLDIDLNVLIPRVDTELLAEQAIKWVDGKKDCRVLDLCTGSGCLGISIAMNTSPDCRVILADISQKALAVARRNIRRHDLSGRVACVRADAMKPGSISLGLYDLIVSNPPYIPSGDILNLDPSVKDYEPLMALDGGDDGLDFYRSIASGYYPLLKKGAALMFECGIGQAQDVRDILLKNGYSEINILQDTQGIDRVVTCILE
ncbi:MAG: peptide chain release factor N(5)-glutamine methyltransferase [Eubacteriales bacterium]